MMGRNGSIRGGGTTRRQVETGEEPRVGMTFIGLSSVLLLPPTFHLLKALQLLKQYQGMGTGGSKDELVGDLENSKCNKRFGSQR